LKLSYLELILHSCSGYRSLHDHEKTLLIADLLSAANSIANIAGTYGCFLSHWDNNALRMIELSPRALLPVECDFSVLNVDVYDVPSAPDDVVYLDPPYTKRQYAAYYHILETIAFGDEPEVEGITGLRPWKEKLSPFCYKTKALKALDKLLGNLKARRVILSYSSEGHMELGQLQGVIKKYGEFKVHHINNVGRYRPNQKASSTKSSVTEYLIELDKSVSTEEVS
jgi:adenine-specific DNA-methyltransferase